MCESKNSEPENSDQKNEIKTRPIDGIIFSIPSVSDPIIGSPKDAQEELDNIAIKIQKDSSSIDSDYQFDRIVVYMHNYLINLVLKQFPYIRGMEHSDTYQEALIALRFKAIPNFNPQKGMSFLNFAKMCIRCHIITLLNASNNRQKDQSMNRAVSIDAEISGFEGEKFTYANFLTDSCVPADLETEKKEAVSVTKLTLMDSLSDFEKMVLEEYLKNSSYKEIGLSISERLGEDYLSLSEEDQLKMNKAVDNALWRIRRKASKLIDGFEEIYDELPIFLKRSNERKN